MVTSSMAVSSSSAERQLGGCLFAIGSLHRLQLFTHLLRIARPVTALYTVPRRPLIMSEKTRTSKKVRTPAVEALPPTRDPAELSDTEAEQVQGGFHIHINPRGDASKSLTLGVIPAQDGAS